MATCSLCGRKLALLGRAAAKNQQRAAGLVEALRRLQATVLEDARAEGAGDDPEVDRFRQNSERLIRDGEHYADQLHKVSHDSGYPGVDYPAIKRWTDTAVHLLQ